MGRRRNLPADAPEIPICEAKAGNIFDLELLEDQVVQFGLEAGKFGGHLP